MQPSSKESFGLTFWKEIMISMIRTTLEGHNNPPPHMFMTLSQTICEDGRKFAPWVELIQVLRFSGQPWCYLMGLVMRPSSCTLFKWQPFWPKIVIIFLRLSSLCGVVVKVSLFLVRVPIVVALGLHACAGTGLAWTFKIFGLELTPERLGFFK